MCDKKVNAYQLYAHRHPKTKAITKRSLILKLAKGLHAHSNYAFRLSNS